MNIKTAYRPMKYSDVVGQVTTKKMLSAESRRRSHSASYIFAGQYGGGKTTLARIHAMAVNCTDIQSNGDPCCKCPSCLSIIAGTNPDVKEIAAAEDNGVGMAKKLSEDISFSPVMSDVKVYILDEAHALSNACWQVLLKVLEEAPEYCMFIMCTTELAKVPLPVRSRSLQCNFFRLEMEDIAQYIEQVSTSERRPLSLDAARVIAKQSEGSMRNALGILEKILATTNEGSRVALEDVYSFSGLANSSKLFAILRNLLSGRQTSYVKELTEYAESSPMDTFLTDILSISVDSAIMKAGGNVFGWTEYLKDLKDLIGDVSLNKLVALGSVLVELVNRKESNTAVVLGEMFLAYTKINDCSLRNEAPDETMATEKEDVDEELPPNTEKTIPIVLSQQAIPVESSLKGASEPLSLEQVPKNILRNNPVQQKVSVSNTIDEQSGEIMQEAHVGPKNIEDIKELLSVLSKKDKLFKWFFLPARKITFNAESCELCLVVRKEDEMIVRMLNKFLVKQGISCIKTCYM